MWDAPEKLDDAIEALVSTPYDPERKGKGTLYYRVAMRWHSWGFNVIPGSVNKAPHVPFAPYSGESPELLGPEQILEWAREWPDATPLLLPDSGTRVRFTVVDADDPRMASWIEDQYGVTPFVVTTGREGGGSHHYYRTPAGIHVSGRNKIIGPDEGVISWDYEVEDGKKIVKHAEWGKTAIDVKSKRNYVVAPGALHRTGRIYQPQVNLDTLDVPWFIAHIPEFDVAAYERHVKESSERRYRKHREIRLAVYGETAKALISGEDFRGQVSGLETEPFFEWAESEPGGVNLHTWWGLATNLVAVFGDAGRAEFHRLSALDPRYTPDETDRTFDKALASGYSPTSYQSLRLNGYTGPIPSEAHSPAEFLSRGIVRLDEDSELDMGVLLGVESPEELEEEEPFSGEVVPTPAPSPPPASEPKPEVKLIPGRTFEEDCRALETTLQSITSERDMDPRAVASMWEAFDKVVYLTTDSKGKKLNEYQGRVALERVRQKVSQKYKEWASAL